jgi:hypothetical protein
VEDKVRTRLYDSSHEFNAAMQVEAWKWLAKWSLRFSQGNQPHDFKMRVSSGQGKESLSKSLPKLFEALCSS